MNVPSVLKVLAPEEIAPCWKRMGTIDVTCIFDHEEEVITPSGPVRRDPPGAC